MELREFVDLFDDLFARLSARLDQKQAEFIREDAHCGDWDEAVDLLVATLLKHQNPVTPAERDDLARLLEDLNEPIARLDRLNVTTNTAAA